MLFCSIQDLINSVDFFKVYNQAHRVELAFVMLNAFAVLPFVANWWLSPIQLIWAAVKVLRGVSGGNQIDEKLGLGLSVAYRLHMLKVVL